MSIPLIAGAGFFEILELTSAPQTMSAPVLTLFFGFLASAIVGWLAIKFLMRILNAWGLTVFGVYRIVLAVGLLTI